MTSAQDTFSRGSEGLLYEVDACPWPSRDGMLPRGLQYSLHRVIQNIAFLEKTAHTGNHGNLATRSGASDMIASAKRSSVRRNSSLLIAPHCKDFQNISEVCKSKDPASVPS